MLVRNESCGKSGSIADHRAPLADTPGFHQAVPNVRIGLSKGFGRFRRWAPEHQNRSIGWIGQRAGHYQLTAVVGFLDEREMLGAKRATPV
jgi:hypothetical protein